MGLPATRSDQRAAARHVEPIGYDKNFTVARLIGFDAPVIYAVAAGPSIRAISAVD
jgi:hypothetical protein